ncbi:uncharacterized protein [Lepeophtheirus salmonis]|uniref:uncharacterized protein isoform X2 n=2 Tax=Lepeophtheirus salmonis TaxID=72036 RepID=UPI001AE79ACC|nr:adenomatous polyposis coli homolog isoform X2 [Lepeophtheirus salmonis]
MCSSSSSQDIAEYQLLNSICASTQDDQHLENLKKRAERIRELLGAISGENNSSSSSISIYENLPFRASSELSTQNTGTHKPSEEPHPPPLPPRVPPQSPPPPVARSHSSSGTHTPTLNINSPLINSNSKCLNELKEERKRLISLHLQEARRYFSELQAISLQINCQNNSESNFNECFEATTTNHCQNLLNTHETEGIVHQFEKYSLENEEQRDSRLPRNSPNLREPRLNLSSSDINERHYIQSSSAHKISASTSDLIMSHHRSANLEQLYREALPLHKVALLSHSGPPILQERLMSHSLQRVGGMEHRAPSSVGNTLTNRDKNVSGGGSIPDDTNSVMSFISSVHSVNDNMTTRRREDIDSKIEGVNSLVSLLGCTDIEKMSRTFLAMSSSQAKCDLMRSHHVIPLLVQLLHGNSPRPSKDIRFRLSKALSNIVHSHPSDKQCKREAKVLKLLEVLRLYTDFLRDVLLLEDQGSKKSICSQGCQRIAYRILPDDTILLLDSSPDAMDQMLPDEHYIPCYNFINYSEDTFENDRGSMDRRKGSPLVINVEETMAILTRCSFDEGHRQPIFMLGGIPVLAELIQVEKDAHGSFNDSGHCTEVKRFAVVALTNLTFGNASIKSFLCSLDGFVPIMVAQLSSRHENLRKATAHLFRNLAWKADKSSKQVLSDSRVVQVLMKASMDVMDKLIMDGGGDIHVKEEPTLKVILSALWNLSAHSRKNKEDICRMDNAFPFLVHLLQQKFPSIVESAGGILRNISSYIATCPNGEAYRVILREHHCLAILLSHLKSPSLTIVSNACGTLWNFSARNEMDQMTLWEMGAVPMLQSLTNSKHKTISTCALAALKNLYSFKPYQQSEMARSPQNGCLPLLEARKKKNFLAEMKSQKLTETCNEEDDEDDDSEMSSSSSSESSSEDEKRPQETSSFRQSYTANFMNSSIESTCSNARQPLINNFLGASSGNAHSVQAEIPDEQPTDYSLRFQEEEEEGPSKNVNPEGNAPSSSAEEGNKNVDCVKTYCTEGTPFDTPFAHISTATSIEDITQAGHDEKPQIYCTEDTPGVFSRADSLSSLDSIENSNNGISSNESNREQLECIDENVEEKGQLEETETEKHDTLKSRDCPLPTPKTVTFHPHETPLMFSRASSVESLNSIEQVSIRDEYSSCDYSRATSGPVSPSDLPDSPCQSRPRTPPISRKGGKADETAPATGASGKQFVNQEERPLPQFINKKTLSQSTYEDGVKAFQEEGTPANFSTRTSLSNLTFSDDEDEDKRTQNSSEIFKIIGTFDESECTVEPQRINEPLSLEDEDDDLDSDSESILEAIISSGMPKSTRGPINNAHKQSTSPQATGSKSRLPRPKSSASSSSKTGVLGDAIDSVKRYRTEDTPGFLSHAGSNSNLSALTIEEDGGNESEERDLLEACINSAMPKSDTPKIFAAQIPTPLGRREDGEGAPSGPGAVSRHSNVLRSNQNPRAVVKPMPRLNRTVPTPMKRTSKNDAQMQCNTSYQYSLPRSGCDTPRNFGTDAYSKSDSLSSISFEDEKNLTIIDRHSLLPRPRVLGRSESSGSSQKSNFPNRETSMSNDSLQDESDEALLEDIIKSGMPKSKSEPLGFNQGLKLAKTEFGVKKRDKKKGRDNSKSPRASKIIPGVRIAELRLLPKKSPISPEIKSTSIIEPKDEPRVFDLQCGEKPLIFSENKKDLEIQDIEIEPSTKVDIKGAVSVLTEDCLSLESSLCSNISMIQPPSIMDSLISMSERKTDVLLPHTAKMECRHTLSAKKGYTVPEMVRRAIGITKGISNEDISSLSSCQSNLDNIKAPTILDDMDNSILSIASISSEVACVNMGSSGDSGSNPGQSLNSEQIFELIRPEAEEIHAQCMALSSNAEEEDITTLEDIAPPTLLDELTTTTSKTLVPEIKGADGLTYTVDDPVDGLSTCHDITDVFDDETIEPTLTLGSYGDADEAPELPRDSRHTTPAHSGGESSHESTPQSKRKLVEQYLNYKVSVPSLDDPSPQLSEVHTAASNTTTSGYKSAETTPTKSSRQRRKEDVDRFKTHTITKEDISPRKSDSDSTSSPKSIKQRRFEEADRFKTRIITASDLVKPVEPLLKCDGESLLSNCATTIKSHNLLNELSTEAGLAINNSPSEGSPKVRPRIRKPSEEEPPLSPKSIRGRRKPLYTSPKRSTVPPSIPPKPSIPFRGAGSISSVSRGGIRSRTTSSASLRSSGSSITTATTSRASPRIPLGSSSSTSSVRSTSSRVSNSSVSRVPIKTSSSVIANKPPPLVRQGTFTKEDDNNSTIPKPTTVSRPSSRTSLVRAPSPSVAQTRTSALRERSASRGSQVTSNSNSSRSSKSSLKTSTSSQSLRTVTESGIPKRAPSNPSIQRYNQQQNLISETRSESGLKRGTNKKEVTSRIASLWKKVEDSKKRNKVKEQQHIRDTKIWISKGKVIPESERALLKVHEEQRKIINEFKSTKEVTTTPREKSRSRLSIRLSKFSLKQKEKTPSPNHEDGEGEDDDKNEPEGVETDKCASSPASAIVQPFNYNPPVEDKKMIPRSRSTVRRNDSYVNSMGRVPPNTKSPTKKETPSSSVMVTLV